MRGALKRSGVAILLCLASLGMVPAASAQSPPADGNAKVTLVLAIPELKADVYVNKAKKYGEVKPRTITTQVLYPTGAGAGTIYTFDVRKAGAKKGSAPVVSSSTTLKTGDDVTILIGSSGTGKPRIFRLSNEVGSVPDGARLQVAHAARFGRIDLWVNGGATAIASGIDNESSASSPGFDTVERGAAVVSIWAAKNAIPAGFKPVMGPAVLELRTGHLYTVVAYGPTSKGGYSLIIGDRALGA